MTFVVAACSPGPAPAPTPLPTATPAAPPATVGSGPPGELTVVVASTDLAVGPNRYVFGVLESGSNPIRTPSVKATFLYLETDPYEVRAQGTAGFVRWPSSRAGVYVAAVSFDEAGRWGVVVEVTGQDGATMVGQAGFVVKTESSSPVIGQPAPPSRSKTVGDASDLADITSSPVPDPHLYQMTIAEAVSSNRPTVVSFATPAFCQTATCGPQVEVVASLKDRYKDKANFIHVEVYDNPKEMAASPSKRRVSPLMQEWGLLSEPFSFVLDRNGLIAAKFEGFVTEAELEASLSAVLGP